MPGVWGLSQKEWDRKKNDKEKNNSLRGRDIHHAARAWGSVAHWRPRALDQAPADYCPESSGRKKMSFVSFFSRCSRGSKEVKPLLGVVSEGGGQT